MTDILIRTGKFETEMDRQGRRIYEQRQNCERAHFCYFKLPSFISSLYPLFWQLQETSTLS